MHSSLPTPPPTLIAQVQDALSHLYDFSYLERHPLARSGLSTTSHPAETPGQRLRRELVSAIESLNPGRDVPFRSPRARLYHLLVFHYIEGMTVQAAAHELGISRRQAHRDLVHGQESIAALLWARQTAASTEGQQAHVEESELDRLGIHPQTLPLRKLIEQAIATVSPLAQQHSSVIHHNVPADLLISSDPVMARQVLVHTLSQTAARARAGEIEVSATRQESQTNVYVTLRTDAAKGGPVGMPSVMDQLLERLGWRLTWQEQQDGDQTITLHIPAPCPTILVVDDNSGFLELIETYLAGYACRLVLCRSAREALRLAAKSPPSAIILDVMMPDMDGWEFLQRIKALRGLAHVPVVVCSVISNPELAQALGAAAVVSKPASQQEIIQALQQVGVV